MVYVDTVVKPRSLLQIHSVATSDVPPSAIHQNFLVWAELSIFMQVLAVSLWALREHLHVCTVFFHLSYVESFVFSNIACRDGNLHLHGLRLDRAHELAWVTLTPMSSSDNLDPFCYFVQELLFDCHSFFSLVNFFNALKNEPLVAFKAIRGHFSKLFLDSGLPCWDHVGQFVPLF